MDDPAVLMRQWFDVVHARDWAGLKQLYTSDADYVRSDGTSHGPEAIAEYLAGIIEAFPDHAATIETALVAGDTVTVEWVETATHTRPYTGGPLGAVPATGKSFRLPVVEVVRFEGSRIASQHEYYDLLSLLSQVGWLPNFVTLMTAGS